RLAAIGSVRKGTRHQMPEGLYRVPWVPHAIPQSIAAAPANTSPHFHQADFCIGRIGRPAHETTLQLLIRAMPKAMIEMPTARLVIFGEGSERGQLEQLVRALDLEQRVFMPGYLDEPARLYRHADVFVNCSITEGMPMTLLEAMREGCPIVATDIPANRRLLEKNSAGAALVDFREEELSSAIVKVKERPVADRSFAKNQLREDFNKNYTAIAMAKSYSAIYENL